MGAVQKNQTTSRMLQRAAESLPKLRNGRRRHPRPIPNATLPLPGLDDAVHTDQGGINDSYRATVHAPGNEVGIDGLNDLHVPTVVLKV